MRTPSERAALPRLSLACALALALLLGGCSTVPPAPPESTSTQTTTGAPTLPASYREEIALFSLSLVGTDYRYGGIDPESGLDCSGLVGHVFQQVAKLPLPHNAARIASLARRTSRTDLAPGDLVFFNTLGTPYSHMGIYLGNDQFLHAPSAGSKVRIDSLANPYYSRRVTAFKTLFAL